MHVYICIIYLVCNLWDHKLNFYHMLHVGAVSRFWGFGFRLGSCYSRSPRGYMLYDP